MWQPTRRLQSEPIERQHEHRDDRHGLCVRLAPHAGRALMDLLTYLERRADRRDERQFLLIERGLDNRSLARLTFRTFDAKMLIAASIIGLFAWSLVQETDDATRQLMIGALVAAFAGAWGYYLGSSSTATKANDRADQAMQLGHEALRQLPAPKQPDVTLAPGESATIGTEGSNNENDQEDDAVPPADGAGRL